VKSVIEVILRLLSAVLAILIGIVIGSRSARYFEDAFEGLALVVLITSKAVLLITLAGLPLAMYSSLPFGSTSITSHEELLDFLQSVGQAIVQTIFISAKLLIDNILTSIPLSIISYALTYRASASRDLDILW